MASVIQQFTVTTPAGTAIDSPQYSTLAVRQAMQVSSVRFRIPPGPRGNLGFMLTSGSLPVFPSGGGWIITDNDEILWPLDDTLTSGAWELASYNTDQYDHTVYLTFLLDDLAPVATVPAPIVSLVGTVVS